MNATDGNDSWIPAPPPEAPPPAPARPAGGLRRRAATAAAIAGLAAGGVAGGYIVSHAATSSSSTSTGTSGGSTGAPGLGFGDHGPGHRGFGGPGGSAEDQQVIASAIGISTTQLQSELSSGKAVAQVAQAHGVPVDTVISKLVASENQEIDQRVGSGQITKAQGDQMKTMTQQRVTDEVNGTMPAGGHRGFGGPGGSAEDQQVIASAIGISTTQLQSELSSGKTVAQVAQAHGVSVDTVISKLVASENEEIDQRVASGQITKAQGDQMKTMTQQRVTDEVNGTHAGGPWGGARPGSAEAPAGAI